MESAMMRPEKRTPPPTCAVGGGVLIVEASDTPSLLGSETLGRGHEASTLLNSLHNDLAACGSWSIAAGRGDALVVGIGRTEVAGVSDREDHARATRCLRTLGIVEAVVVVDLRTGNRVGDGGRDRAGAATTELEHRAHVNRKELHLESAVGLEQLNTQLCFIAAEHVAGKLDFERTQGIVVNEIKVTIPETFKKLVEHHRGDVAGHTTLGLEEALLTVDVDVDESIAVAHAVGTGQDAAAIVALDSTNSSAVTP